MSIFEAQSRKHSAEEDMLTSAVFGTLEAVSRDRFLAEFFRRCEISPRDEAYLRALKFTFWESTGRRRPDVILRGKSLLVSIECKLSSPLHVGQLKEEYMDAVEKEPNSCWLVVVTRDNSRPDAIDKAKNTLSHKVHGNPRIQWVNWQTIYDIFSKNAQFDNVTEQRLVEELLSLLAGKGLMMFKGFGAGELSTAQALASVWPELDAFRTQCSAFFATLNTELRSKHIHTGELGSMRLGADEVEGWMGIDAWHDKWGIRSREDGKTKVKWPTNQCLMAHLHLNRDSRSMELIAGYDLRFNRDQGLKKQFAKQARATALIEKLGQAALTVMFWRYGQQDAVRYRTANLDELEGDVFSSEDEDFKDANNITLGRIFSLHELMSSEILAETERCMTVMRDLIQENGLYFRQLAK